jgi:DNA-binding winged helix-turn-helix (wHTH) protein
MLHLGSFELDPHSGELTRAGKRIHLPNQSARLLVLLATRAPAIVRREEIRRALWGDALHVEFDAAVNACISQIRSALGDSARSPRFIETIPRHGYRCLVARPAIPDLESPAGSRLPVPGSRLMPLAMMLPFAIAIAALVSIAGPRSPHPGSPTLAAMQKYERGISGLSDAGPEELIRRVQYFETAIAADPEFAAAYAGLAGAKLLMGAYRVEPGQIAYAAAKAAAQKALSIDPDLADAHAMFGAAVLNFEWDWRLAEEHLRRAVAIDRRLAPAQLWWSRYLTAAGRHDAAIDAAHKAVALAPGSPSALTQLGIANFYARRIEAARAACAEAGALMREFLPAHACVDAAAAIDTRSPNLLLVPAIELVRAGDRERAIDWLQRAANRRSDSLIFAGVEPAFEPLRGDPRFTDVLKRVGAPLASGQRRRN